MTTYLKFQGKRLLTQQAARNVYNKTHQDILPPKEPTPPEVSRLNLLALGLVVLAVNVLSGAHTIPMIQEFYLLDPALSAVIGVSGFLAIEGAMLLLMSQEERSWLGWIVVLLAFAAALAANTYKTFEVFAETNTSIPVMGISLLFGVFAPSANLVAGEILHRMQVRFRETRDRNRLEWLKQVSEYEKSFLDYYGRYLTRQGVPKDIKEAILAGSLETLQQEEQEHEFQEKVQQHSPAVRRLLKQWKAEKRTPQELQNTKLKTLADRYGVSTTTISKARKEYE